MMTKKLFAKLERLELSDIPDLNDKLDECEFFAKLAIAESDSAKFRWFFSAFLSSARSFIDTQVKQLLFANGLLGGASAGQRNVLDFLERYFVIFPKSNKKTEFIVKASHPVLIEMINIRNKNVHETSLIFCCENDGEQTIRYYVDSDFKRGDAFLFIKNLLSVLHEIRDKTLCEI